MSEWKDFSEKIQYIHEKMCNFETKTLIEYFSIPYDLQNRWESRRKTINNWLSAKVKKPNRFIQDFPNFKISQLKLPNEEKSFFKVEHFSNNSIDEFKKLVDEYLSKKSLKIYLFYGNKEIFIEGSDKNKLKVTIKTDEKENKEITMGY